MRKVAENNKAIFYTNDWTVSAESYAKNQDIDLRCFIAETKKDDSRSYILVQDDEIIYSHPQFESIGVRIDIIGFLKNKEGVVCTPEYITPQTKL